MTRSTEKEPFPPRWAFFVAALMILAGICWNIYMQYSATVDKQTAQANSQVLAQDIQTICETEGKLLIGDRDICPRADSVLENPTEAIPGPIGEPGKDGRDGSDSTVPGPAGSDGPPGKDSTVPGPPGRDGIDSTVPGPAGADSTVPGPPGRDGKDGVDGQPGAPGADSTVPGPSGPQGEPGRGIADTYCQDNGLWQITYTDGTVDTDAGRCRSTPPIGVTP